ncbi:MAG: Fe-S cluster assembly protein SufD [Gammaproteobacteria bacterium]|nr:Fe-S cluster assembly protein SufD [Gammaproteobacteria bacterium]
MTNWLSSAAQRGEAIHDWLAPRRQASLRLLQESQWPTRKTEAWKYVPINVWERAELSTAVASNIEAEPIEGLNSFDIVIRDGQLQADTLAAAWPEGLQVLPLASAEAARLDWAQATFAQVKPERHLFGLVNDVLATDGLIIDVADGARIERPLRIVNIVNGGSEAHARVLVRIGSGAKVSIVEHYVGNQLSQSTGFAEYSIGTDAELEHYRFALQSGEAMHIGGSHFDLAERATLTSNLVAFGSRLSRVDMDINHKGEGAKALLNAIYLLDGKELFDLHSNIEHAVANGTSEENVRGIVADNSRAVFNGRIHIHRHAQKTLAELNNRNLLLSDRAEINTKPELEIYADDVRCAHGATVAEIDKKAMYYLQSRGIEREQAQIMLNFGFINELVDDMPNAVLAEWLRPQLRQRFAAMEVK